MESILYKGEPLLIGTCETLSCVPYYKFLNEYKQGYFRKNPGSSEPYKYLLPNSGHWFRLPFHDEKERDLWAAHSGEKEYSFKRYVPITIDRGPFFTKGEYLEPVTFVSKPEYLAKIARVNGRNPNNTEETVDLELAFQGPTTVKELQKICLVLAYRCPYSERLFSVRRLDMLRFIIDQVRQRYVLTNNDTQKRFFWEDLLSSIEKGYEGVEVIQHQ